MSDTKFERNAGILMPVSSLPSPYGIGTFGKDAYDFVTFVKECNHKYWQVLPLGPTTYGDSPYQSYSAFAGNPYFVDLDMLIEAGFLLKSEVISRDWGDGIVPVNVSEDDAVNGRFGTYRDGNIGDERCVSYEKIYNNRFDILRIAYNRFKAACAESKKTLAKGLPIYKQFDNFVKDNADWLEDYALFMALKSHFNNVSWGEWETDIKFRKPEAMSRYEEQLSDDIGYWKFIQFEFYLQWNALKQYANSNGIEIIGDIPIYMGYDSVDVWANQGEFQLDENLTPIKVAGVPPDAFSDAGQKWGNPLYDYDKMEANGFSWWRKRMAASAKLYDVIRIDHFIGIVKYYTIPADMPDARQGEYRQGPGQKLLDAINESIGDKKIIAEDLGVEVPEVAKILKENGYPGMKVLEFAFGGDRKNPHLPYNYTQNLVCYGGTHDNETLLGFFEDRGDWELGYAYDYLDTRDKGRMVDQVFRAAYSSVAVLTVFAVQDILKLGNWARMNLPSSMGNNWKWRMQKGQLGQHELECMRYLASVFDRERK
ncbi:4-alpha-glucanotransferase [Lachnospira eligens]|uniref:4-alpha-glucanotransferase n=1 Tax=Lachnospira eligens TaxID=39485 RepID=UPI000E467048|nr:4-alpha-glucanotransferase [Lachnospira eligens]RHI66660.1 4-alpha-glucanotransferase [Lachnospira eligens]